MPAFFLHVFSAVYHRSDMPQTCERHNPVRDVCAQLTFSGKNLTRKAFENVCTIIFSGYLPSFPRWEFSSDAIFLYLKYFSS